MNRAIRWLLRHADLALGFLLFVPLFWPTWRWMAERFDSVDSFYSPGWLVPLAVAWLVWQRRDALTVARWEPDGRGLWLLAPAVIVYILAVLLRVGVASGFAMLAALAGLIWTIAGYSVLRILRFPILFLFFMIPLPSIFLISVSFTMKLWAARIAAVIVGCMGIPAVQAGSMIRIPGVTIIVDDVCSGLRSLISLTALAVLWAWAVLPRSAARWQRWAIVACAWPIALMTNMVRIVLLILISAFYGAEAAQGYIHTASGLVVFGLATVLLAAVERFVMSRRIREALHA